MIVNEWPELRYEDWRETRDTLSSSVMPSEVAVAIPFPEDHDHSTYKPAQVSRFFCYPDDLIFELEDAPPAPSHKP